MQTREIRLSDKEKIEEIRRQYGHTTASHAFASLYIWKEDLGISLAVEEEAFAVKCSLLGNNTWFFPCGRTERVCSILEELLQEKELCLLYMRQEDKELLEEYFPGQFAIKEAPSDSEYIYDRQEQEELKGRRFSAIRNHINRAKREHVLQVTAFTGKKLPFPVRSRSMAESQGLQDTGHCVGDEISTGILLSHADALEVQGVLVSVEEEPYAVVAGFALSQDTFDMCLAKQKKYLTGLSNYAKHEWIKTLPRQYTKINAEEDLGIEGLRMMKKQMQPVTQILMYEGRALNGKGAEHK